MLEKPLANGKHLFRGVGVVNDVFLKILKGLLAMKPPSTESKCFLLIHVHYVYLVGCESMPKPYNSG